MKKLVLVVLAFVTAAYLFGCKKKEAPEEPLSMEQIETMGSQSVASVQPETAVPAVSSPVPGQAAQLQDEALLPQGPYKPTAEQIQTALKNAGYYAGIIDGKIGPMSKKAIKDFQQANALEADGKVGPKTWALLGKHLNASPSAGQ